MKIGLQLPVINTFRAAVWGDEVMAVGLADALSSLPEAEFAEVYSPVTIHDNLDIVINFYPFPDVRQVAGPAQFWWYQASISPWVRNHPDFTKLLTLYRGFFVASPNLATELIELGVPQDKIMFLPMSANSRFYRPVAPQAKYAHNLVFCGNNHPGRTRETIERYLLPIRELGLVIYGNGWDDIPELKDCSQGPMHPKEVPALYSSARIILSTHPQWHRLMDVPTSRLWEAAACSAFIISDKLPTARQLFGDTIVWTDGWDDLREKVRYYLEHEEERKQVAQEAYQLVLSQYTFDHWANKIMGFVQDRLQEKERPSPVINKSSTQEIPLVSVIVPTYNRPEMLEGAIRSILNQTYSEIEILVVNDGGEETEQIINSLDKDHKITYIKHSQNHERSAARNTALKLARGKYIAYLDDADIFYPHHLETLVNFLESNPYKVAYTDALRAHQVKEEDGYKIIKKDLPYSMDFSKELLLVQNIAPILCFMHEKSCLNEVGLFDETLTTHEDWDLWIRMSRKYDFAHIEMITAEFRTREDGSSTTSGRLPDFLRTMEIIFKRYEEHTKNKPQIIELQNKRLEWLKGEIHKAANLVKSEKSPGHIKTSIVIVTYNSLSDIKSCLDSIGSNTGLPYEIIIIDNASTDGTQEYLKTLSQAKILLNRTNNGFSRACNQGIREAKGEYIVLLNPDTLITQGWDTRMIDHFKDGVGAVGPISNYVAGVQRCDLYLKGNLNGERDIEGLAARFYQWNRGQAVETKLLIGFCLVLKREVIDKVGLLDEELFLGNDDLEYSLRLRRHGYKLLVATDTFIYHKGQASFQSELQSYTQRLVQESTDILYEKLKKIYKDEEVPTSQELWGIDWFRPSPTLLDHAPESTGTRLTADSHQGDYRTRTTDYKSRIPDPNETLTSIVVLTYNQLEYTSQCLASIEQYTSGYHELILVDNGSTDGTVAYLEGLVKAANGHRHKLICNKDNLGFAKGSNQGIEQASGDYILLLNNDVIVTAGWLERMLACFERDSSAGIVGPCSNRVSGPQLDLEANYNTVAEMQEYAQKFSCKNKGRVLESPKLVGFCLLIKREVLDKIGLLDERFGSGNFEDDDLCLRARQAGYKCLIARDVFIHHFGGRSFKGNSIDRWDHYEKNLGLFVEKWGLKGPDKKESLEKLGIPRRVYASYYNDLGERYYADAELEKAKGLFLEAIEIDANFPHAYNNLGVIAWQEGDKERALQLFLRAYSLDGQDGDALANLVSCSGELGRYQELEDALIEASHKG